MAYKIARLGCVDPRCPKGGDGVFYFGSAGGEVNEGHLRNIQKLLPIMEELDYITHTDCKFSFIHLGIPLHKEYTEEELARAEEETTRRRIRSVRVLLNDAAVRTAIRRGMKFRVGSYNVATQEIEWLDLELAQLMKSAGLARFSS